MQRKHMIHLGVLLCMADEALIEIGRVKAFLPKLGVAVIALTAPLSVGECILIKGDSTAFEMTVDSIQIENQSIQRAEGGQSVNLTLTQNAQEKDAVYKKL